MSKQEELEKIKQRIQTELKCPLKDTAKNLVFGKGNPEAQIMFIGEAPGEQEDIQGEPFVGRAGKQLDEFLHEINLCLKDVYIANVLKYRPPNNRNPAIDEIKRHTPYLVEQIKIIQPKVIVTLGNFSTKFVLSGFNPDKMDEIDGITKLHGQILKVEVDGMTFTVIPAYHPAAILYKPGWRVELEKDFQTIKQVIS